MAERKFILIRSTYPMAVSTITGRGSRFIDLTGREFGRLRVVRLIEVRDRRSVWQCRCQCGQLRPVFADNLRRGHTTSCGCWSREQTIERSTKHGCRRRGKQTAEYGVWCNMLDRCSCARRKDWKDYGGRGIKVCKRWQGRRGFANFLLDLGTRPTARHLLERKNNNKGYGPANCCWATRTEQNRNKRSNVWLTCNGRTMILTDWSHEIGIRPTTLRARLQAGWPLVDALTRPVRKWPNAAS